MVTNFQISDEPLCDPTREDCSAEAKHPYKVYEAANLNMGIISIFACFLPLLLFLAWRMPITAA